MHAGPQALLSIARQKYWPENGKRLAQSIVKQCVLCTKSKPKLMEQIMGNLPAERITQARPFIHVSLDFAGPITIHYKIRGKRATKAYVCVFVCSATKAVHIEAAADLTTERFISCLKRFIARRGLPRKIFCDNATNFASASNQLMELKQLMDQQEHQTKVIRYCQDHHIEWKFIPPRSPHFGGLHEACVKSLKHHLRKVLHSVDVTYDELITILAEIEAILNSRPLTPMSSDPNDLQPLTAGHFLIGAPMNCIDDQDLPETSKTKMWTKINRMKHIFWNRWKMEYLAELQHRNKWLKECENIKVGTMVILKEINTPPLHWRMARVTKTITDEFGKIRVVMVKTDSGELKRAIHEIAPLPVQTHMEENQPLEPVEIPKPNKGTPKTIKKGDKTPSNPSVIITRSKTKANAASRAHKKLLNPAAPSFQPRMTRAQARNRISASSTMMMILGFFIAMAFGAIASPCDIRTFDDSPGLYYEEHGQMSLTNDDWSIVCYVQLDDYWSQAITIKKLIERLDEMCPQLNNTDYCDVTRKQLRAQLNVIYNKNDLIRGFSQTRKRREWPVEKITKAVFNTLDLEETEQLERILDTIQKREKIQPLQELVRRKRGWANFIGSGLKTVTGVMDDDDAKQMDSKIDKVDKETKHLLQLISNQTTIQEITQNILKREEAGVALQLKRLENEISVLRGADESERASLFNAIALQTVFLINCHINTQNSLINMITQAHQGQVSPNIITPTQLKQHMITISSNISKDLMIPGNGHKEDLAKVYSLLTAQIRVTTSRIIIKINMPLLHREFYKLYHIIPVPFVLNNSALSIIEPLHNFIGINTKQDHYYVLTHQQKQACKQFAESLIICDQMHPLHNTQGGEASCEMAIFSHQVKGIPPKCNIKKVREKQIWSKMSTANHFIFTMADSTTINLICKESSTACELTNSGIISLPQQCIIQSGNIEITAHNEYSSEVPVMFIPGINISDVLRENYKARNNTHGELNNFYVPDSDLDLLEAAIRTQKLNENYDPNHNTVHNTHHYIMVYLTLLMVAVFVSWYIYTKKLVKCCARKEHTRVPVRDIEMVFPTTEQPFPALRTTRVAIPTLTSIDEQVSFAS